LEPSLQFYFYLNQEDSPDTGEFCLKFSHPVIASIKFFTTHSFDIVRYRGSYFGDAGLSFKHEFNSKLSMDSVLSLAWASNKFNEVYIGFPKTAFNLVTAGVSFTYYVNDTIYLSPHIETQVILDSNLQDQLDKPTIFNGGLAIGMEF